MLPPINEIDFVMIWVDDADPQWLVEKAKYSQAIRQTDEVDRHDYRYRDWDNLRYWFRAVEKFAPWVRKIHFVTAGHLPPWLNIEHPQLNHVKHSDYIPTKYLPTFSSYPIELNLHRIKDLREQFVYFNDDMFILRPVAPTDFFVHGKPCAMASLSTLFSYDYDDPFYYTLFNHWTVLHRSFPDKRKYMMKNLRKYLSFNYDFRVIKNNLSKLLRRQFYGFDTPHGAASFLKSTFVEVWQKVGKILDRTCEHKFRSVLDVHQYLIQNWQIMSGNFYPYNFSQNFRYFDTFPRDTAELAATIINQSCNILCLNDTHRCADFVAVKNIANESFAAILGEKSGYEK
ncbi:glycosyl transferase [Planctomycetales bacterium]|nr:glycosyl transferase [Planctomycetales bacterium]GHS98134.1 glycosyl transferase [Planctomycetales bacterium]GHT05353.1 glycosyl transferase [Planctomycetales bacterium]